MRGHLLLLVNLRPFLVDRLRTEPKREGKKSLARASLTCLLSASVHLTSVTNVPFSCSRL